MRKGGERRLRHDVGAKAKTVASADRARELVDSPHLLKLAGALVDATTRQGASLDDKLLESALHELVRRAIALRRAT